MEQAINTVQWIVQKNVTSPNDLEGLREACKLINVNCIELNIIPFTNELPAFEIKPCNIYYGSTTFTGLIYNHVPDRKGLFFDPLIFSMENYIEQWGKHMLNSEASVITFKELMERGYDGEKMLFIRPNNDDKSFSCEVRMFSEIAGWYKQLAAIENSGLNLDTKIVVSEPYNIQYEWRLWIVNKQVIAASKYREYFKLTKEAGCPDSVIAFAEDRCEEYTPHDIFVMDICLCGDTYYIVECGCMNGAGFYKADISTIVSYVTAHFAKSCQ
ncbi:DUF4343 domain-containing protein [Paraflavitalea soli]|uniref:DUF4343 domain-containing protein n=1 Tax=Paraflavitalea soli TaxID=2315862 RepID=A0A3B7MTS0_9BACT|nr:ATP-grasp domain-containing protein [Paraflavitalea soli]AXY77944.1 DUF4343 domain-containing protein [Paraflavitalea soli]